MLYLDVESKDEILRAAKFIRTGYRPFSIYINGSTVRFMSQADMNLFADGLECFCNNIL